jgi:hypothetical protein
MSRMGSSGYSVVIRESLGRFQVRSGEIQRGLRISRLRFSFYTRRAQRALKIRQTSITVPHLDRDARIWLRESLMRTEPEHAWLSALKDNPLT